MSKTVLVTCRDCAGTGLAAGGVYQCEYCLGQSHILVNRTSDGGIPDQEREWCAPKLGPVPANPLVLASEVR